MFSRRILCALAVWLCSFAAQAHDFVTERAWVEDPNGTMALAQVQQAPETPFDAAYFTQGFSKSVFWLRLHIDPSKAAVHSADKELVVRIQPPMQDQIQLFDPLDAQDRVRFTGDYFDWANDEYRSLNLNFVVPIGAAPRDIWLRLQTHQSTLTMVEVLTMGEVRAVDRRQEMGTMFYLAILIICMGWGVMSFINQRDFLVGAYIIRELLAIVYALVVLGYFRTFASGWLPVAWVDPASNIIVFSFVAYVIWFDSTLINQFRPNRWLVRLVCALALALPIEIVLFVLGMQHHALVLNGYIVLVAIVLILLTAISTRAWQETRDAPADQKPVFSKAYLVGTYSLVFVVVLINRLSAMGVLQTQELTLYLVLVYALLSSCSMMILVQVRSHRLSRRQREAQYRLELAKIETVQERERRIEQSNFLKMLAHEMKTPLSVVRMAIGAAPLPGKTSAVVERAVADMNGIIERLLQVERLQDQQIVINRQRFDLEALVQGVALSLPDGQRLQIHGQGACTLMSDQQLVRVIVANLLENALKYSPPTSRVDVTVSSTAEFARIMVKNDIGTAGTPDPAQVFAKYYRADRARERTGSGLGLFLVRSLVILLGGQVRHIPTPQTVQFEVVLPR